MAKYIVKTDKSKFSELRDVTGFNDIEVPYDTDYFDVFLTKLKVLFENQVALSSLSKSDKTRMAEYINNWTKNDIDKMVDDEQMLLTKKD